MTEINGLQAVLGHVDFSKYSRAEDVQYGSLVVSRWFPAWWGISPWASPYWRAENSELPEARR